MKVPGPIALLFSPFHQGGPLSAGKLWCNMPLPCAAGIRRVKIRDSRQYMTGSASPSTGYLLSWLLGRHDSIHLGFSALFHGDGADRLMAAWANPCVLPKLSSQLTSLQLQLVDLNVCWPVLFQLKALEFLQLRGAQSSLPPDAQFLAERELPHLTTLILRGSSGVTPLLVGCSLPRLKKLDLVHCKEQGGMDLSCMTPFANLEVFGWSYCNITKV